MNGAVPKVLAVHDMSCAGRCSLTVVLPVMAACGIEAVPLPTAIFSNHLAFSKEVHVDFTDHMTSFMNAWDENGISFDAVYSGFLASPIQIHIVEEAARRYALPDGLIVTDPAMADNGKLYAVYTPDMVDAMKHLIRQAKVIKPNYTEACFLTGQPYEPDRVPSEKELRQLAEKLAQGPRHVIITSIPAGSGQLMNLSYDALHREINTVVFPQLPMRTFGTGDIFCSAVTALLIKGVSLSKAVEEATAFLNHAIEDTIHAGTRNEEGILFENRLPELTAFLKRRVSV